MDSIETFLIGFVTGSLVTCAVLISIFQRYMIMNSGRFKVIQAHLDRRGRLNRQMIEDIKEQEERLNKKKQAIQELLKELNHQGSRPSASTILGCINSYRIERKELEDIRVNALIKPHHNKWNGIAKDVLDRMDEWVKRIEVVGKKWLDLTRKYEDLQ